MVEKIPEDKESYTKDELKQIVAEAQQRQFQADDMRAYGNAFFAEAMDHIGTLGARDPFWKRVYQYGLLFKKQFETNTGQIPPEQPPREPIKSTPAPTKSPFVEPSENDSSGYDGS
jgi:hypothetical protein